METNGEGEETLLLIASTIFSPPLSNGNFIGKTLESFINFFRYQKIQMYRNNLFSHISKNIFLELILQIYLFRPST